MDCFHYHYYNIKYISLDDLKVKMMEKQNKEKTEKITEKQKTTNLQINIICMAILMFFGIFKLSSDPITAVLCLFIPIIAIYFLLKAEEIF